MINCYQRPAQTEAPVYVRFAVLELMITVATFLLFSRNSTPPRRETTGKLFQCALWIGREGMGLRHDV